MILRAGGKNLLGELIGIYLEDTPQQIKEARDAIGAGDFKTASRAVHSLISISGNIGADSVMNMAVQIEKMAEDGDGDGVARELDRLECAYNKVRVALEAELQNI